MVMMCKGGWVENFRAYDGSITVFRGRRCSVGASQRKRSGLPTFGVVAAWDAPCQESETRRSLVVSVVGS
jgi:hypothetical protein